MKVTLLLIMALLGLSAAGKKKHQDVEGIGAVQIAIYTDYSEGPSSYTANFHFEIHGEASIRHGLSGLIEATEAVMKLFGLESNVSTVLEHKLQGNLHVDLLVYGEPIKESATDYYLENFSVL